MVKQVIVRCDNCDREIDSERVTRHPNVRFCNRACHDRFWSRPYRRLRALEKRVEALEKRSGATAKYLNLNYD